MKVGGASASIRSSRSCWARGKLGICGRRCDQIFEYQKQASRDGEDWSHVYDEVAAQVNAEGSAAHQLTAESAAAAHKLAEAEHRQLFRESPSARYIFSLTPARWRGG